jgi:hypothetical protein
VGVDGVLEVTVELSTESLVPPDSVQVVVTAANRGLMPLVIGWYRIIGEAASELGLGYSEPKWIEVVR